MIHPLVEWGWNGGLAARFRPYSALGLVPGRVIAVFQELARVVTADGEALATVTGKFRFEARGPGDYPAVGDWVAVQSAERPLIHHVLPRDSAFTRKAAGGPAAEQVVAANVTTVFLVTALNADFNLRRLERYLALAWASGATPVVVLSKADLTEDAPARVAEVSAIAPGVAVLAVSSLGGRRGARRARRRTRPARRISARGAGREGPLEADSPGPEGTLQSVVRPDGSWGDCRYTESIKAGRERDPAPSLRGPTPDGSPPTPPTRLARPHRSGASSEAPVALGPRRRY